MTYIHINYVRYSEEFCQLNHCPTCERQRRMLGQFQEWYGTTWTCAGCGEMWTDSERHEREFRPGWRRDNVKRAVKRLTELGFQA